VGKETLNFEKNYPSLNNKDLLYAPKKNKGGSPILLKKGI